MGRLTASVPRTRLFTDPYFGAAAIPLRSGLRVCLPPASFLPQQVLSAGQLRLLRPSRTCIVTFARIGYAIRPTTGNWRNEDFHLARFTALSTAPLNRGVHPNEVCRTCATFGRTDQLRRAPLLLEENDTTQSPAMKTTWQPCRPTC